LERGYRRQRVRIAQLEGRLEERVRALEERVARLEAKKP
jgi:hypothetical protein